MRHGRALTRLDSQQITLRAMPRFSYDMLAYRDDIRRDIYYGHDLAFVKSPQKCLLSRTGPQLLRLYAICHSVIAAMPVAAWPLALLRFFAFRRGFNTSTMPAWGRAP